MIIFALGIFCFGVGIVATVVYVHINANIREKKVNLKYVEQKVYPVFSLYTLTRPSYYDTPVFVILEGESVGKQSTFFDFTKVTSSKLIVEHIMCNNPGYKITEHKLVFKTERYNG